MFYVKVLCLTIKYLARAFSGTLGREKPWQVLSVILIFGLQSSTSVMDLVRCDSRNSDSTSSFHH